MKPKKRGTLTGLPWRISGSFTGEDGTEHVFVTGGKGVRNAQSVCKCDSGDGADPMANARMIAVAVNHYADLMDLCRSLVNWDDGPPDDVSPSAADDLLDRLVEDARELIKRVEKEAWKRPK